MTSTKKVAHHEADSITSSNTQIERLLRQRAHVNATALRWNRNTLLLAYVNLTVAIILTLMEISLLIVALAAFFGLALLWLFSWLQVKRLENKLYEQEIHNYSELSASKFLDTSDLVEEASLVSSTESPLTHRELVVLEKIAKGMTNKNIAYTLQISKQTVKNHVSHIFWKLDVGDRTSAVLTAMRRGWIKDDNVELLGSANQTKVPNMPTKSGKL